MPWFQVPHDPDRAEMVGTAEVEELLDDRGGRGLRVGPGAGLLVDEPGLPLALIGPPPHVEQGPGEAEVPTRLPNVPRARRVLERPELPPNISCWALDTVCLLLGPQVSNEVCNVYTSYWPEHLERP